MINGLPGYPFWKVVSWLWIGLWLTTGFWVYFSKKGEGNGKGAFWLYFAYAPLGLLYDLVIGIRNSRKRKPVK